MEYAARLGAAMEKEKLHLDPGLTLAKLAQATAIPAKHLSQVINERYRQNFNDFVNRYRVEAAKRLLLDPAAREFKLLRIAYESGFNSKSVFNAAFKKHAGLSPSEFRRLLGGRRLILPAAGFSPKSVRNHDAGLFIHEPSASQQWNINEEVNHVRDTACRRRQPAGLMRAKR